MATNGELEHRLEALEKEVADLKRRVAGRRQDKNWIDRVSGQLKDFSEWDDVARFGREFRDAQIDPPE